MTVECGMLDLKEVNNMGFDVHVLSPKMNVELDDTSIYGMWIMDIVVVVVLHNPLKIGTSKPKCRVSISIKLTFT